MITSKIVSSLLNSPIIFIGYSLTDLNIKNIIKNFSNSLDEKEKSLLSKRIIIINWKKDEEDIIETKKDGTLFINGEKKGKIFKRNRKSF